MYRELRGSRRETGGSVGFPAGCLVWGTSLVVSGALVGDLPHVGPAGRVGRAGTSAAG